MIEVNESKRSNPDFPGNISNAQGSGQRIWIAEVSRKQNHSPGVGQDIKEGAMMTTHNEIIELNNERTAFFETLSQQFIAVTGCGVYVYLSPVDINGLFNQFMDGSMPIRIFVRQCVKNVLQ